MNNKLNHERKFTRNFLTRSVGLKINGETAFKSRYFNISIAHDEAKDPIYIGFNKHGIPTVYDVNLGRVLTEKDGFKISVETSNEYKTLGDYETDEMLEYIVDSVLITNTKNNHVRAYVAGKQAEVGSEYKRIEKLGNNSPHSEVFICVKHDNTFDLLKPEMVKDLSVRFENNPYLYAIASIRRSETSYTSYDYNRMVKDFEKYFGELLSKANTGKEKENIIAEKTNLLKAVIKNIKAQDEDLKPMVKSYQEQIKSLNAELEKIKAIKIDYNNEKEVEQLKSDTESRIRDTQYKLSQIIEAVKSVPEIEKYLKRTAQPQNSETKVQAPKRKSKTKETSFNQ